jgi:dTDP-4-dehydrorhamnose 3,5-epimerase
MTRRFEVVDTPIAGLKAVRRQRIGDARGSLVRLFCADELRGAGWDGPVAQINHTLTAQRGTIRGMHFQRAPHAEIKLVSCLRGEVWDVAVDLRAGSPTFGRWHAERLSPDNDTALLIPRGCAHGFQALTDNAELLYVHSAAYAADAEGGVDALDPRLAIAWPLPVGEMSARDRGHPRIDARFEGLVS